MDTVDLGAALRAARQERGLHQAELAARVGVTRMTISRMERGEPVISESLMRALSECGAEVVVIPKFARVTATPAPRADVSDD